jgi:hypothetical protein
MNKKNNARLQFEMTIEYVENEKRCENNDKECEFDKSLS